MQYAFVFHSVAEFHDYIAVYLQCFWYSLPTMTCLQNAYADAGLRFNAVHSIPSVLSKGIALGSAISDEQNQPNQWAHSEPDIA